MYSNAQIQHHTKAEADRRRKTRRQLDGPKNQAHDESTRAPSPAACHPTPAAQCRPRRPTALPRPVPYAAVQAQSVEGHPSTVWKWATPSDACTQLTPKSRRPTPHSHTDDPAPLHHEVTHPTPAQPRAEVGRIEPQYQHAQPTTRPVTPTHRTPSRSLGWPGRGIPGPHHTRRSLPRHHHTRRPRNQEALHQARRT